MNGKKQIEKMPICVDCIHAYVCEEYNLNRDMLRKKCAYHNDHFLNIEQHDKEKTKEIFSKLQIIKQLADTSTAPWIAINISDKLDELAKQYGVEEN